MAAMVETATEVSSGHWPRIESWLALWAIAALVAAPCCVCQDQSWRYGVGGESGDWSFNWRHPDTPSYYQDWADRLMLLYKLYVNDSLYFSYDSSRYDVLNTRSEATWESCSINDTDIAFYSSAGSNALKFLSPGTFRFMSSGLATDGGTSPDCRDGMKFRVTVLSNRTSDPPPPPPPPPPDTPAKSPPNADTPPEAPPPRVAQPPPPPEAKLPAGGVRNTVQVEWSRQQVANHYETKVGKRQFVGTTLEFIFEDGHNVREVDQSEYKDCTVRTARPLFLDSLSPAPVNLTEKRTYYFIDSLADNCRSGNMKLSVQVVDPEQETLPVAGEKKTFPVAAVVVPSVIIPIAALASLGFLYCRRQYGPNPRGRYPERHVVTSDTFRPSTVFGKSVQTAATLSDILEGKAGGSQCTIFTYEDLQRATNGFSADNVVGSGGFGTVFQGTVDDGRKVAIKMAKHASDVESFVNEVSVLSGVNNRNLVKLLGCCIDVDIPLLVYEFIPNGTLQDHLVEAQGGLSTKLDWDTRFKIALQTAEALKYLHVQATPPIFHRDVKSANVLLDDNFNAKVADFGLAKLVDLKATHVSTAVRGTPGYLDPEYFHNWQLTDKTDVYSFGVVLLELITSQKPIDLEKPTGEQNLSVYSEPLIRSGRFRDIIDSHMASRLSPAEFQAVEAVAKVAVACLVPSRASRPSMTEVVEMLQRIKGSRLKAEEFYGRVDATDTQYSVLEMAALGSLSQISLEYSAITSTSQATSVSTSQALSSSISGVSGDVTNLPVVPR